MLKYFFIVIFFFGFIGSIYSQKEEFFQIRQGANLLVFTKENDSTKVYLNFVFRYKDSFFIRGFFFKKEIISDTIINEVLELKDKNIQEVFKLHNIPFINADPENGVLFKDKFEIEGFPYFKYLDSADRDTVGTPFLKELYYEYISNDNKVFGLRNYRYMHEEQYIYLFNFWFLSYQFDRMGVYNLTRINYNEIDLYQEFNWKRIRNCFYGY